MAAELSQKHPTLTEVVEELKRMSDIGFPILAMGLVGYLKNMILVVCMGRLGSLELAGGALAIGFTNITGYSVLSGLASGMEPLCSQAFGSTNFTLVSLTLRRTILMLLLASFPIGVLWFNLQPLMLSLHQNPDITRIASLYCRFAIPDLVANSFLHPLRVYLRSQCTTWPLMWSNSLATLIHIPLAVFLIFTLGLGVVGAAVSTFITNFSTLLFLLSYIFLSHGSPKEALWAPLMEKTCPGDEWGMLLRMAVPSCLAVCLEWWWYEFMTLLAGYLYNPRTALAASAIVIQTTSLLYTLPSALSGSVSAIVGNELGAGRPVKARLASLISIALAIFISMFSFLWTILGRQAWGRVFTEDPEVLELTMVVLPIIGLCELVNCPQTTCCGVLRGSARPNIGAGINFYAFYLVGTPMAIGLAFVLKLGFLGLCYGLLAAQVACAVSILTVVFNTDWERESSKAKYLVGENNPFAHAEDDQIMKCEEGVEK